MDVVTLSKAKKYAEDLSLGFTTITDMGGGVVRFALTSGGHLDVTVPTAKGDKGEQGDRGLSIASMYFDADKKMVLVLDDGTELGGVVLPSLPIDISKAEGNAIDMKSDGIYVAKGAVEISKDEGNAIEQKADGLYVADKQGVEISKDEGNILEQKDDGLYVPETDLSDYAKSEDIQNEYVKQEEGKSLISDTEIERLAKVDNYDDTEIKEGVAEAKSIAEGKSRAKVFDTKADMEAWLAVEDNIKTLHIGDNFYIVALDTPDYWWDGTKTCELEGAKVDLSGFIKDTATAANDTTITKKGSGTAGNFKMEVNENTYIDMDNQSMELVHTDNSIVVRSDMDDMALTSKNDVDITSGNEIHITSKDLTKINGNTVQLEAAKDSDVELKTSGTGKATYNDKEILVNGFNNAKVNIQGNHNVRVAASDASAPVQAYVDLYLTETEPDVFKSTASIDADETFVTNYQAMNVNSPKINLGTTNTTTTTVKGQLDVRGNETIHNGDFVMEHEIDDDNATSLELSISENTALIEGVDAELELKASAIRFNGTAVAEDSLYVDNITTNKSNKVTINENTKVNGDLEITGDLKMGDSGMKAMYFETKGGDVTIKDDDGSVIHELSKKMDSTDLLSTSYVFGSEKPNQLNVNGAFVAKNSDDSLGKHYKKRDSWLKMTRNGIRMGIISSVKNWDEIRRNFIELGNHTLRIFSTKRVEVESDEHVRIGSYIGTNSGYSPWRPYQAQLDVSGKENRIDLSNGNAKFSVDSDGIEAKCKESGGYSWGKFRIGAFPAPYTWNNWHKKNPLGIPTEENDWKRRVPFTEFHVDTTDDVLISRHAVTKNRIDNVSYVDWTRDSYLHLSGYEAKLMYAKNLDANGYLAESSPHYGIKVGPHSGVQVYGYLMAGGLNPMDIKPLVVRGGLKIFPKYYTGNGKGCWEFKEDGIYFNGVKKVSV